MLITLSPGVDFLTTLFLEKSPSAKFCCLIHLEENSAEFDFPRNLIFRGKRSCEEPTPGIDVMILKTFSPKDW
jgi:hypothetical protein